MASPWALLKQAVGLFISNFIYFLRFWLVQFGIIISIALLGAIPMITSGIFVFGTASRQTWVWWPWIVLLIAFPIGLGILVWLIAAMYTQIKTVVEAEPKPVKELFKLGWRIAARVFLTTLLSGLLVVLGLALLVIPGVIVGVWFWLAIPVLLMESKWGWQALMRSRELVAGRFWPALWYAAFPALVIIVLQLLLGLGIKVSAAIWEPLGASLNVVFPIVSIPIETITTLYLFLAYKAFASTKA